MGNVIVYLKSMWPSWDWFELFQIIVSLQAYFRQDQFKFPSKIVLSAGKIWWLRGSKQNYCWNINVLEATSLNLAKNCLNDYSFREKGSEENVTLLVDWSLVQYLFWPVLRITYHL